MIYCNVSEFSFVLENSMIKRSSYVWLTYVLWFQERLYIWWIFFFCSLEVQTYVFIWLVNLKMAPGNSKFSIKWKICMIKKTNLLKIFIWIKTWKFNTYISEFYSITSFYDFKYHFDFFFIWQNCLPFFCG